MQTTCHPSQWGAKVSMTKRDGQVFSHPRTRQNRAWLPVNKERCLGCVLEETCWAPKPMGNALYPVQCSRRPVVGGNHCESHRKELETPQFKGDYPVPNINRLTWSRKGGGHWREEKWNHEVIAFNDLKREEVHHAATKISACWRGKIAREHSVGSKVGQETIRFPSTCWNTWCELKKKLAEMNSLVSELEERLGHGDLFEDKEFEYLDIIFDGVEYHQHKRTGEIIDRDDFAEMGVWDSESKSIDWADEDAEKQHESNKSERK
jgi:hypothetical protein